MTPIFPKSSPVAGPLKTILWALLILTVGGVFLSFFGFYSYLYLGITLPTLSHGFIWTLLTYPFTAPPMGTFDALFRLACDLFFLWVFGSPVIERIGQKRFSVLFFGSTLLGGLAALLGLYLWSTPPVFAGPSPALLALVTAWTILHAERTAHLGSFVFRPFWIFVLLGGFNFAISALNRDWTRLLANSSGALFGYAFCLISERTRSTIAFLYPIERVVLRGLDRFHSSKQSVAPKIIDFHTGEPILSDEQFMDAMLARISLHGEESLSQTEKQRMQKISKEKSNKKK